MPTWSTGISIDTCTEQETDTDGGSALKPLFLAIREASGNWKSTHHWKPALQSFQLRFGEERVPLAAPQMGVLWL